MNSGDFPHYGYPEATVASLLFNLLSGRLRSFRQDGKAILAGLKPPLRILGQENIPKSGAGLITFNHYYRPGFNAWWMALGIAAAVPQDIHFVMTGELTFPGKWYAGLGMFFSRLLLKRIAHIYGFTNMPPMPPRPKDVERRAQSVRETLAYAKEHPDALLGLAPEGGDQPGGVLTFPASGAGRFILLLANMGFKIIPVGAFEADGQFCLDFGTAYEFKIPRGLSPDEKDHQAAKVIMEHIARQLPAHLRGEFGE